MRKEQCFKLDGDSLKICYDNVKSFNLKKQVHQYPR